MIPTLSQVSTLAASFEADVADYAAAHCGALEIWFTKLEAYLRDRPAEDVRRLLAEYALAAPVASLQGGLFTEDDAARGEAWKLLRRRLGLCRELGIATMVVAGDVAGPASPATLHRVTDLASRAAAEAARHGVRLAYEFQASASIINNLQTAAALVERVASPHLGLCLDVFHYYVGPSKPDDLEYLLPENLFHAQLCDVADVPRELASDRDRILPGDGDIPLAPIVARLRQIGYAGCVSVELMNPRLAQIPPLQLAEIGMTALRKVLGLAAMG